MFQSAEIGNEVTKEEYEARVPQLRVDLVNAQFDLRKADFSVVVLVAGDDRLGCNDVLDVLNAWMDARYVQTDVFGPPSEEERERPRYWRYWRVLPPKGRIQLVLGGWATNAIADRVFGDLDDEDLDRRVEHARRFEEELAADGTLVLKFWLHLPKKELKKRLDKARKHPKRHWQVEGRDWDVYEAYDEALEVAERVLRHTDRAAAPWQVVEATDARYRDLSVAGGLRDALVARLSEPAPAPRPKAEPRERALESRGMLSTLDLAKALPDDEYDRVLPELQGRLARAQRKAFEKGRTSVLAFEGWDAAGKGGCIRRITGPLPARDYRVVPISAPSEEERARHYLWRFWRHLPRAGRMLVFDRSWYGRVLVERVERLTSEHRWRSAYEEINDFEEQLVEHGLPVVKFWLHIDPEEQLERFRARERTPYKKYKITPDDYRNRERWDAYERAADEMIERTSTAVAPWHLVPANDKRFARTEVLRILCEALEAGR